MESDIGHFDFMMAFTDRYIQHEMLRTRIRQAVGDVLNSVDEVALRSRHIGEAAAFFADARVAAGGLRQFDTAREIAKRQGVDVSEVYVSDDLFLELRRAVMTPEQYGSRYVDEIHDYHAGTVFRSMAEALLEQTAVEFDESQREACIAAEVRILFERSATEDHFREFIQKGINATHEASRQMGFVLIVATWGYDGFSGLPKDMRHMLYPQRLPLVPPAQQVLDTAQNTSH